MTEVLTGATQCLLGRWHIGCKYRSQALGKWEGMMTDLTDNTSKENTI